MSEHTTDLGPLDSVPAATDETPFAPAARVVRSVRSRLPTAAAMIALGTVGAFGLGLSAAPGQSRFALTSATDAVSLPVLALPGRVTIVVLGALTTLLGVAHLARGIGRRSLKWAVTASVLGFVVAFLCWAGSGDSANPLSVPGLLGNTLGAALPLILGALAGILCERTGVINIAIEGQMLLGAFAAALFTSIGHSLGLGLVSAAVAGGLMGLVLAIFSLRYRANQVIIGVVLNAFALGLTNLGFDSFMQADPAHYNGGLVLPQIRVPGLVDIPIIGRALFDANLIVYLTYVLVVAVDIALFRTRWGLRSRAVGEHPTAAGTVGIRVSALRYRNVVLAGLIVGLAGAMLTIGGSGQFNTDISSGRGFIALAAVIFGRWNPRGAVAAALLFGFVDQLQSTLSIIGTPVTIPSPVLAMLPYVVTVFAVVGLVGNVRAPAASGQV